MGVSAIKQGPLVTEAQFCDDAISISLRRPDPNVTVPLTYKDNLLWLKQVQKNIKKSTDIAIVFQNVMFYQCLRMASIKSRYKILHLGYMFIIKIWGFNIVGLLILSITYQSSWANTFIRGLYFPALPTTIDDKKD